FDRNLSGIRHRFLLSSDRQFSLVGKILSRLDLTPVNVFLLTGIAVDRLAAITPVLGLGQLLRIEQAAGSLQRVPVRGPGTEPSPLQLGLAPGGDPAPQLGPARDQRLVRD